MNYEIVKDEKMLKEFIEWLPELKPTEKYYMCLFARNKYCKELTHIKTDKSQLKRFLTDKGRMFQKIKQLEIAEGWYLQKETPVPQRALALYITPNPREMWKAAINTMVKIANSVRDQNLLMNVHQEAMSEVQRTKSRTCWVDFDFDTKTGVQRFETWGDYLMDILPNILGKSASFKVLETRGGYHVLVNPESVEDFAKGSWYQSLSKVGNLDQTGDNMMPVPGCTQGEFIPHFINL
jgi:hypothetical protein